MAVVLFGDVLNKSSWYVSVLQSIFSVVHVVPRKYFSVTQSGEAELRELVDEWNELKRIMEGLGIE